MPDMMSRYAVQTSVKKRGKISDVRHLRYTKRTYTIKIKKEINRVFDASTKKQKAYLQFCFIRSKCKIQTQPICYSFPVFRQPVQ